MLELQKISDVEMDNLKEIIQKGVEKSELERYYLFSDNVLEKAKLFCYCHRFLYHLYNILVDGNLKSIVKKEIDITLNNYITISFLLSEINTLKFGAHRKRQQLHELIYSDKTIDNLIDAFAILLERANLIDINKIQAFILEGKSKDEYNKIFKSKVEQNVVEDVNELAIDESEEEINDEIEE